MRKWIKMIVLLTLCSGMTACSQTELEERCFPQMVAVGYEEGNVTFLAGFPKVNMSGEQGEQGNEMQVPMVSEKTFSESQSAYEGHLNKVADYNHLKILVLEEELIEEVNTYGEMLKDLAKSEAFPRNTYVCAVGDIEDLVEIEPKLSQDVGTYMEEYLKNHEKDKGRMVTLGDLMDEVENQKMIIYIPFLAVEETYVDWAGYVSVQPDGKVRYLDE